MTDQIRHNVNMLQATRSQATALWVIAWCMIIGLVLPLIIGGIYFVWAQSLANQLKAQQQTLSKPESAWCKI